MAPDDSELDEDTDDEAGGEYLILPEDELPEEVAVLAASCVDYVRQAVGVELDVSAETLPLVDHYLIAAREQAEQREELALLIAQTTGAYFGEVARRMIDGFWLTPSDDPASWLVCGRHVFVAFRPMAVAVDALFGTREHAGPSSRLELAPAARDRILERLAAMPDVPEDEYYLLSTRLEVLEVVAETLSAEGRGGDDEVQEIEPDEYLQFLDDPGS